MEKEGAVKKTVTLKQNIIKKIKRSLIASFLGLALIPRIGISGTPYHSIDKNNFYKTVAALRSPANNDSTIKRIATFCKYNFSYESDIDLFGKIDYWQSPAEMFYRKKGDCEDYAAFIEFALKKNDIPNVSSWISFPRNLPVSHVFVVAPYKGKWSYLDSSKEILNDGFSSSEDITDKFWERQGDITINSRQLKLPQDDYNNSNNSTFANSSRLKMHSHLTECKSNQLEIILPLTDKEREYSKLANKEAVGILLKTKEKPLLLKAVGFSYSEHGWYSPSREYNDKMYTAHFLFSNIGINAYTGDYRGVDIDINPINLNWMKAYVCERNFGEVWDFKTVFEPVKFFVNETEINDKKLNYGFYLKHLKSSDSYVKAGYNSEKEFRVEIKEKNKGCNMNIGESFKLNLNFEW